MVNIKHSLENIRISTVSEIDLVIKVKLQVFAQMTDITPVLDSEMKNIHLLFCRPQNPCSRRLSFLHALL